jgi:hypothetical protein
MGRGDAPRARRSWCRASWAPAPSRALRALGGTTPSALICALLARLGVQSKRHSQIAKESRGCQTSPGLEGITSAGWLTCSEAWPEGSPPGREGRQVISRPVWRRRRTLTRSWQRHSGRGREFVPSIKVPPGGLARFHDGARDPDSGAGEGPSSRAREILLGHDPAEFGNAAPVCWWCRIRMWWCRDSSGLRRLRRDPVAHLGPGRPRPRGAHARSHQVGQAPGGAHAAGVGCRIRGPS